MTLVWLNGAFQDVAEPEALRQGDGVFDTLLAIHGEPQDYDAHMTRLIHDAQVVLGMTPEIDDKARWLLDRTGLKQFARVRTTVKRDIFMIEAFPCPDPATLGPLTCAIIDSYQRQADDVLENCKRLDYSRSFAARKIAQTLGADEAILTNTAGFIACGATSNLFIEEDGMLITPPLNDGALAGITRQKLLDQGAREEHITQERLLSANKAFLTNSIFGIRPIILA